MNSTDTAPIGTVVRTTLAARICEIIVGGVLLFAAVSKLLCPGCFVSAILGFKILPHVLVNPFAVVLPWVEIVCGVCLIVATANWRSAARWLAAALFAALVIAVVQALIRGLGITCGCFGPHWQTSLAVTLIIDLVLLAILFIPIKQDWSKR